MARETFLSTRDDLKWLRETHLKSCRKLPRFSVAILHGNEDAPDSITLYERNHVDSKSVTLRADEEGNFSCEAPTRTRKNPVGKDGVLRLGGKMVTVPMQESKRLKPQVYGYRVDLNERGEFRAGVQDANGNDVWTVQNDDERDGEIPEIEDRWMKHWNDGAGLQNYLVSLGVIARGSSISPMSHAEQWWHDNDGGEVSRAALRAGGYTKRSTRSNPGVSDKRIAESWPALSREQVKKLGKAIRSAWYGKEVDAVLDMANVMLEGYGVEGINDGNMDTSALYINLGDSYDTTLLYDTREQRFYVTSWGDYVEANEKRFGGS